MLKTFLRNRIKGVRDFLNELLVPRSIKASFRQLPKAREAQLVKSLMDNFFKDDYFPPSYFETEAGRRDFADHLYGRLSEDRITIVPWLNTLHSLKNATILEIGCGTGTSTVALAEQGSLITAIEIYEPWLTIARDRCRLYDLEEVEFHRVNACDVDALELEKFDIVVFFACIEHMTLDEKLTSIGTVWRRLNVGSHLVVIHTPNRLWWHDFHTSHLPFFNWLPDDVAIHYSHLSPRWPINLEYRPPVNDTMRRKFTRLGRAASYHEFQLAIPDMALLRVASANEWIRKRNPLQYAKWFLSGDRSFQRMITSLGPKLPNAFYEPDLNFSIKKGVL